MGALFNTDEHGGSTRSRQAPKYVTDESGNVIGLNDGLVVLDDDSTEGTTAEEAPAMAGVRDGKVWKKIVSIVLPICAVLIALAFVIIYKKKPELLHPGKHSKVKKPKKPKNRF